MNKRFLSLITIAVMLLQLLPAICFAAEEKTAVEVKLDKLKEVYSQGSYFTNSGKSADPGDWGDINSDTVDSQLTTIPSRGGLPAGSEVGQKGTSCFAFAVYCFYYIFGHDFYKNVTKTDSPTIGDAVFFWYSGGAVPSHYAIYLGEDEDDYYVYDSNWNHDCSVREYGKIRKTKYAYITAYHANGYDELTAENNLGDYHTLSVEGQDFTVIKKGDTFTLDMQPPEKEGFALTGYNLINSRGEYVTENEQKTLFLQGQSVVFDENILKYPSDTLNFVAVWEKAHEFSDFTADGNAQIGIDGTKTRVCSLCNHKETVTDVGSRLLYDTTTVFEDVGALWYKPAVDYCYTYNLFAGISDTSFGVSENVTRGMYVTVLARIAGVEKDAEATTEFTDVETGRYYTYAIAWAKQNGIVAGMSETEFCPDSPITRAQICVMTVNFAKFMQIELAGEGEPIVFVDGDSIPAWAKEGVDSCTSSGIVNGYAVENGFAFNQGATATRAESAQILYKFYKEHVIKTLQNENSAVFSILI